MMWGLGLGLDEDRGTNIGNMRILAKPTENAGTVWHPCLSDSLIIFKTVGGEDRANRDQQDFA